MSLVTSLPPGPSGELGARDLILRLGYGVCTQGQEPNAVIPSCQVGRDRITLPISQTISTRLSGSGVGDELGLVGLESDSSWSIRHAPSWTWHSRLRSVRRWPSSAVPV